MSRSIILGAMDGGNPLAFLATLGTLRLLGPGVRIRWQRSEFWRPEIDGFAGDEQALSSALLGARRLHGAFKILGENLTVPSTVFREFADAACARFPDRGAADFVAAFGSEVCEQENKNRVESTMFCFITGSGHQDFIGTAQDLADKVTCEHIREVLFGPWTRSPKNSFRWDPQDAAEYALRWDNPGPQGASAVWGANLLAFEALPLFPAHPTSRGLATTGFIDSGKRGEWPQFTWPIWSHWAALDSVRSLLSLKELCKSDKDFDREALTERGVAEVFRAQRVRIGHGANFKVSFRPARAI